MYYKFIIIIVVLVSLGVTLWGYNRIPDKEKNKKEFVKLGIGLIIPLFTLISSLVIPKEVTSFMLSPELEDKIKENDNLKKEIADKDKIILNTTKEKEKLLNKVKELNEKNYAEIKSTDLVIDGLKIEDNASISFINNSMYVEQDTVKKIVNKEIIYDETTETVYVGNNGQKITKEALEDNYSMLYNGKNYISLVDTVEDFSVKEPRIAGIEMKHGFILKGHSFDDSYVLLRLDGKYSSIEFDAGMLDNTSEYNIEDGNIKIELDGKEKYKEKIAADIATTHYKFDVTGAKTLKIILNKSAAIFGFHNVIFNK